MTAPVSLHIRLGTRGSLLARTQSQLVADELMRRQAGLVVELVVVTTSGDRMVDQSLADAGGKGLFTRELETALLAGTVDLAVHSYKDVPVTMPLVDISELVIAAVPQREDVRDVLVTRPGLPAPAVMQLPPQAVVGTSSLRRRCQLLAMRPDLKTVALRGNIDTRLRKLRDGQCDAILLAAAGLNRSGLMDTACMSALDAAQMLPAAGQGALAIQCRRDNTQVRDLVAVLDDEATRQCVAVERGVVERLQGDCHSPIAACARLTAEGLLLQAAVGRRDGEAPVIRAQACRADPQQALEAVLDELLAGGAVELLRG